MGRRKIKGWFRYSFLVFILFLPFLGMSNKDIAKSFVTYLVPLGSSNGEI